jgi:hypothetical protein
MAGPGLIGDWPVVTAPDVAVADRVSILLWETVAACSCTAVQASDLHVAARSPELVGRTRHALRIVAAYGHDLPHTLVARWLAELAVPAPLFGEVEQAWRVYQREGSHAAYAAVEVALRRAVPDPVPAGVLRGPGRQRAGGQRGRRVTAGGEPR